MTADRSGRLRLTVLGCSSAVPHAASPAAGFLVDWEGTTVLLDAGQGVVRRLERLMDPRDLAGVVIGHMHADHFLDLAGLRYLFPWGEEAPVRLPVHLPPGAGRRMDALAEAISERPHFFDAAYAIDEYDPDAPLAIGPFTIRFRRGRHYIPAWAMSVETPDGARLVYTGDTGPSDAMVEFAREADLLLVEAGLRTDADDDPERGHLTARGGDRHGPARAGPRDASRPLRARSSGRSRGDVRRVGCRDPASRRRPGTNDQPAPRGRRPDRLAQEIVRTGCAAAWAARTLIRAATIWAMAVSAWPAGPGSR